MSSLPRQRGVTEFQPERGGFSLTLTDQGQTNNRKCNPSGYPTKFWGLVGRVSTIAHTTEHTFLIGSFAKLKVFHWLKHCHQYVYQISTTYIPSTYIAK